jgi:hypothetical protein
MAEQPPNPVLASKPAEEPLVYRPISGLAIAGLVVAGLFALLVVVNGVAAFVAGVPFFLSAWMVWLAAAGAVLSLIAQWHIRGSEGTRAGLALCRWGLGLSVVMGVGYLAYEYFTGLAIVQQANSFVLVKDEDSGFLARLEEGDPLAVTTAFLLTWPPSRRSGLNPANEEQMSRIFDQPPKPGMPGELTSFRNQMLVQFLGRAGNQAKVEPLGIQSWNYEKGSFTVSRNYRITTPEAVFSILLPVQSAEAEAGGRRRWFVALSKVSLGSIHDTPLGTFVKHSYAGARASLQSSLADLPKGKPLGDFSAETDWTKVGRGLPFPAKVLQERMRNIFLAKETPMFFKIDDRMNWALSPQGRLKMMLPGQVVLKDKSPIMGHADFTLESQERVAEPGQNLPDPERTPPKTWKVSSVVFGRFLVMAMKDGKGPPKKGPASP